LTDPAKRAAGVTPRLKRAGTFIAIVWGVAASFIAFEVVSLKGVDLAFAFPTLFGNLMISQATKSSTACVVARGESAEAGAGAAGFKSSEVRAGAWLLGLRLGQDGIMRQFTTLGPDVLTQSQSSVEQLASAFKVPAPGVFVPQQVANAPREFMVFVEADARGTAHQLAVRFSPEACQLYKLGAFWGYSMIVRLATPGPRAILAPEIRYYAIKVGLPDALWQPMVARSPTEPTASQIELDTPALTEGVTRYLLTQP
jgi:hypothetical protein